MNPWSHEFLHPNYPPHNYHVATLCYTADPLRSKINTAAVASPKFAPEGEDRVALKLSIPSSRLSARMSMEKNASILPAGKVTVELERTV